MSWDGRGTWHILGENRRINCVGGETERDHLGDLKVYGRIILKLG